MWRRSRASATDFALGDLSVVPRLGATERCSWTRKVPFIVSGCAIGESLDILRAVLRYAGT